MLPLVRVNIGGLLLVGKKHIAQACGECGIVDNGGHLLAEAVAAWIDVARRDHAYAVVADKNL